MVREAMVLSESDQRNFRRLAIDLELLRKSGQQWVRERAVNLSFRGLSVATHVLMSPGSSLELVLLAPPGMKDVPLTAKVQYLAAYDDDIPYLAGLAIVDIAEQAAPAFDALLTYLVVNPHRGRTHRLEIRNDAVWRDADQKSPPRPVTLLNLSVGGAMVAGPYVPEQGARGQLSLVCPDDGQLGTVAGTVRWHQSNAERDQAGIEFGADPSHRSFLQKVLRGFLATPREDAPQRHLFQGIQLGDFEVGAMIGRGGMCDVYRGRAVSGPMAGQEVALKRLRPEASQLEGVVDRFLTEADLCRMIQHPQIARVHTALTFAQEHWIAMELVAGLNFADLLAPFQRAHRHPPVEAVASIVLEVLKALHFCHTFHTPSGRLLEVVHGDVTPGNVLLTRAGEVKLTDFGVASTNVPELNQLPGFAGKLFYLAPELYLQGSAPTPRVDIYQTAVLLYEALTLEKPFDGRNPKELAAAAKRGPLPPSRRNPSVGNALEALVLSALNADPSRRPASAAEFKQRLEATGQLPSPGEAARSRSRLFIDARG